MMSRVLVLAARFAQADFPDGADGGQRRPHLVRGVGGEAPQLLEGCFEPAERVVEHRGEVAQFVIGVGDRQAGAQACRRDAAGCRRHPVDRRQRTARHQVGAEAGNRAGDRQAEPEHDQQAACLLPKPLFRPGDPHNRGGTRHRFPPGQFPQPRAVRPRNRPAQGLDGHRVGGEPAQGCRGQWIPVEWPAVRRPDEHPGPSGGVGVRRVRGITVGDQRRQRSVGIGREGCFRPFEVLLQLPIEVGNQIVADEHEHPGGVQGEDDDQRGQVPEGQPHADASWLPRARHGSSSRNTKPTPRTV